jgi:hypothetical protein
MGMPTYGFRGGVGGAAIPCRRRGTVGPVCRHGNADLRLPGGSVGRQSLAAVGARSALFVGMGMPTYGFRGGVGGAAIPCRRRGTVGPVCRHGNADLRLPGGSVGRQSLAAVGARSALFVDMGMPTYGCRGSIPCRRRGTVGPVCRHGNADLRLPGGFRRAAIPCRRGARSALFVDMGMPTYGCRGSIPCRRRGTVGPVCRHGNADLRLPGGFRRAAILCRRCGSFARRPGVENPLD